MTTATAPATLTLADAVRSIVGDLFPAIEAEFVDLNNDLRVATVREIMDCGPTRDMAEKILFIVKDVYCGKDIATALAEA